MLEKWARFWMKIHSMHQQWIFLVQIGRSTLTSHLAVPQRATHFLFYLHIDPVGCLQSDKFAKPISLMERKGADKSKSLSSRY
jgi:hypothetical protein